PDGSLDPSFSNTGLPGLSILSALAPQNLGPGVLDHTEAIAVQQQGGVQKLVLAAGTPAGDFGIARLLPSGQLDPTFGTGGVVTVDFGGNDDADSISLTP